MLGEAVNIKHDEELIRAARLLSDNCAEYGDERTGCCAGCLFFLRDKPIVGGFSCELTRRSPDRWNMDAVKGTDGR